MMKRHLVILLALAAPALAHNPWDGQTYTVQLSGESGAPTKTDTFTFQGGNLSSEWLTAEGFSPAPVKSDEDDFSAEFFKGEDRVHVHGELEDGGKLEGKVRWNRHHEGGHRRWKFEGAAGAAHPAAAAPAPAAEAKPTH